MSDAMSDEWFEKEYLPSQEEKQRYDGTWGTVVADIFEREKMGKAKYGKYLTPSTSEDMLQHLYEELLDATVYIKTLLLQRENEKRENVELL